MTKFSQLSDDSLDQTLQSLVRSEREVLLEILLHLREADRRRLYSKYGFKSLFEYAVKRFSYSEDAAWRRISAMRLLNDLPEIETKIEDGSLSLTNIARAQSMFRSQEKEKIERSRNEKIEILEKLEHCSKREAEKLIAIEVEKTTTLFGANGVDAGHPLTEELKIQVSKELMNKLKRLLKIKSHSNPCHDLGKLIEQLTDLALAQWDPVEKAKRYQKREEKKKASAPAQKHCVEAPKMKSESATENEKTPTKQRRTPPAATKHALTLRDRAKCTNCGSEDFLQIDHSPIPYAKGGSDSLENLRLLCRPCNQRHAIETYGVEMMDAFLREPQKKYLAC